VTSNIVDNYIHFLRDKVDRPFGHRLLHTVRGVGYALRA
jgi:two-component system, OmpR family, response regulator